MKLSKEFTQHISSYNGVDKMLDVILDIVNYSIKDIKKYSDLTEKERCFISERDFKVMTQEYKYLVFYNEDEDISLIVRVLSDTNTEEPLNLRKIINEGDFSDYIVVEGNSGEADTETLRKLVFRGEPIKGYKMLFPDVSDHEFLEPLIGAVEGFNLKSSDGDEILLFNLKSVKHDS